MNESDHLVASGHAQKPGPVERLRCCGANGLVTAIGGGPHCASCGQPEFWHQRGGHQGSPTFPGPGLGALPDAVFARTRLSRPDTEGLVTEVSDVISGMMNYSPAPCNERSGCQEVLWFNLGSPEF